MEKEDYDLFRIEGGVQVKSLVANLQRWKEKKTALVGV